MTTLIPFQPTPNVSPPFSATFTLDGNSYDGVVVWSVYAQRWYLTLTDQNGNRIITTPLIGSPLASDIFLAPGIFMTSTLLYRADSGNFEQTP